MIRSQCCLFYYDCQFYLFSNREMLHWENDSLPECVCFASTCPFWLARCSRYFIVNCWSCLWTIAMAVFALFLSKRIYINREEALAPSRLLTGVSFMLLLQSGVQISQSALDISETIRRAENTMYAVTTNTKSFTAAEAVAMPAGNHNVYYYNAVGYFIFIEILLYVCTFLLVLIFLRKPALYLPFFMISAGICSAVAFTASAVVWMLSSYLIDVCVDYRPVSLRAFNSLLSSTNCTGSCDVLRAAINAVEIPLCREAVRMIPEVVFQLWVVGILPIILLIPVPDIISRYLPNSLFAPVKQPPVQLQSHEGI